VVCSSSSSSWGRRARALGATSARATVVMPGRHGHHCRRLALVHSG
jgi:hypothetical protein